MSYLSSWLSLLYQLLFMSTASTEFLGQHGSVFFIKMVANAQQLFLHVLLIVAPFYDDLIANQHQKRYP